MRVEEKGSVILIYLFLYELIILMNSSRLYESKLEIVDAEKRKAIKQLQRFKVLNVSEEST